MKFFSLLNRLSTAAASLVLFSCAPSTNRSQGLIANDAQLSSGSDPQDMSKSYWKTDVDYKKYDSIIIEPVRTVVVTPGVSAEVRDQIASNLGNSLYTQFGKNLKIASAPGPSTLLVRAALTDGYARQAGGRPVAIAHPAAAATLTGTLGSEEVAMFISQVAVEGELLDSTTGVRLVALADQRIGGKREATAASSWAGVRSAIHQGVVKLQERFESARAH